ncbi:hypothetical protein FNH22_10070 [Fulvivirga sp. M361]|uniref:DUF5777 family beta-barrel protein n=1 Tax=Fulvivirga sp. M361 TaxID=2594266 RepID=UPI00117AB247|nr:DUF5777 family beta-barrel protein [Fulvivirga sp. M361]TRX59495.1 hypothetical protein FNH22_10070 [Fulvivirga sp. M361]
MKYFFIILFFLAISQSSFAQDDLMDLLDEGPKKKEPVYATFKGSRVILGHSVKLKEKKELEFLISHRFGALNSGAHEFWGLDAANIRLGLEYGLLDNLNIGVGRSSFDKSFDGFIKYKLVQQSKGPGSFPFSIVLFSSVAARTTPRQEDDATYDFNDRLAGTYQILIGKKISPALSLQLMPVFVHKNRVAQIDDNDQAAIGVGGRIKLTKSLALNLEYYYRLSPPDQTEFHNSLSVGLDIETGGHVFQLHFTNSDMTLERAFVTETTGDFFDGDIRFGFNISRTFQLGGKRI